MSEPWSDERARSTLRRIFDAAPGRVPTPQLQSAEQSAGETERPLRGCRRRQGVGRDGGSSFDEAWPDVDLSGVVVTRYGHAVPAGRIRDTSRPLILCPMRRARAAARAMLDAVRNLGADDLVVALISGGGSALMALPAGSMTLADKQAVNKASATQRRDHRRDECGAQAPVGNQGRPSRGGGSSRPGRHACRSATSPATIRRVIASGPTVPDPSTRSERWRSLNGFGSICPQTARAAGGRPEGNGQSLEKSTGASVIIAAPASVDCRPPSRAIMPV